MALPIRYGVKVKLKNIISMLATLSSLLVCGTARCDDGLSYDDTVKLIKNTMVDSNSGIRQESYGYIRFDNCRMDYNVLGIYPAGEFYDLKFSGIEFSSLNASVSKIGHDYTDFVILSFAESLKRTDRSEDMMIRSVVINAGPDEKTQLLFKTFLHLGELCGAPKSPL